MEMKVAGLHSLHSLTRVNSAYRVFSLDANAGSGLRTLSRPALTGSMQKDQKDVLAGQSSLRSTIAYSIIH